MSINSEKLSAKVRKLHALVGSDNAAESAAARAKLLELLAKHKLSWNDLPDILAGRKDDVGNDGPPPASSGRNRPPPALDLVSTILERHLRLSGAQLIALSLWICHTFVYSRFPITPRLVLSSPVRGCGKTTVLDLVKALAFKARKFDHVTPAVLFRIIDRERPCILLDEVDNQDLPVTATLRSVINSGHRADGTIARYLDGEITAFSTFAPLASPPSVSCLCRSCTGPSSSKWNERQNPTLRGSIQKEFHNKPPNARSSITKPLSGCEAAPSISIRLCRRSCATEPPIIGAFCSPLPTRPGLNGARRLVRPPSR